MGFFTRLKRHLSRHRPFGVLVYTLLDQRFMHWALQTQAYEWLTRRRIAKIVTKADLPITVQIEPTNICNARCVMCPNPTHKRQRGYMTYDLFTKVVDDIRGIDSIREITLSGFGEPFLDKRIIDKIKYVKQSTSKSTILFSNFSLVSEDQMRGIIDAGLDAINISFNGFSADSYKKTMGLDFNTARENITRFIALKKEKHAKKPLIVISCVLTEFNENEAKALKQLWSETDGVYIGPPDNWVGSVNVTLNKHAYMNEVSSKRYPCRLFYPIINWNGDVSVCCRDYDGALVFGNLKDMSFMDIWNSPRYTLFRSNHYGGKIESICARCDVPYKRHGLKWWDSL